MLTSRFHIFVANLGHHLTLNLHFCHCNSHLDSQISFLMVDLHIFPTFSIRFMHFKAICMIFHGFLIIFHDLFHHFLSLFHHFSLPKPGPGAARFEATARSAPRAQCPRSQAARPAGPGLPPPTPRASLWPGRPVDDDGH